MPQSSFHQTNTYAASEQFCYDALNRLTNYSVNGATCRAGFGVLKSVTYDDIGNITNKSDLADPNGGTGTYSYPNPQNPLPHAVKSISGTVNGTVNPGYRYDADGNLTCEYTGPNCSHGAITKETDAWWSFNAVHTISEGTTSLTFTYDSEHARIIQALTNGSTTVTTTYLNDAISGGMEDHVVSGSTTTWNDYLMADGKLIAERTCSAPTPTCSSGVTTQYLITDHLGSVGVVTDGTVGSSTFAQVTARESFDAWGKQRNPDWSDDTTCSTPLAPRDREVLELGHCREAGPRNHATGIGTGVWRDWCRARQERAVHATRAEQDRLSLRLEGRLRPPSRRRHAPRDHDTRPARIVSTVDISSSGAKGLFNIFSPASDSGGSAPV